MTDDRYMIQMDLATGGDLEHMLINKNGTYNVLPDQEVAKIFLKTAAALSYCHSLGVVHRDLKLDNILIQNNQPVIIDFELAAINDNINKTMYSQKTMCGTPLYIAYEVTSGKQYDGRQADKWSFGIIFYVLLTGRFPYHDSKMDAF